MTPAFVDPLVTFLLGAVAGSLATVFAFLMGAVFFVTEKRSHT